MSSVPVKHHLVMNGERKGPFTLGQLQSMWRSGAITTETMHHMDGYTEWMPLEFILADLEPQAAVAAYRPPLPPQTLMIAKSRGVYIILGLFVGGLFGIHNFYAGRFGVAVAQLLITVFTFWLILPLLAVALWVLIECIVVTRDGNGVLMA